MSDCEGLRRPELTDPADARYAQKVAAAKSKRSISPPAGMSAYRVDASDELVIFVWDSEQASSGALAPGEREVLRLLLAGLSNSEIAAARGTSARTVANQVASLLKKLGARSRYELIGRMSAESAALTSCCTL